MNENCRLYKKKNKGHIKCHHVQKGKHGDIRFLRCSHCKKKFSENKGTMFYRKKSSKEEITKVLHSLSEGMGIRATGRIYSKNKNTVASWLKEAGERTSSISFFFREAKVYRNSN